MRTGKTKSGVRYAIRRRSSGVAFCSLSVACGTRAEGEFPEGTAHFVEHAIFKGTAKRSASQISSRLDRLGGELNAYTTKEEIVLHATVLREDLWTAVDLLLELAREASFPEKEIEIERGVVLDEIISSSDVPSEDIYDRFESLLFEGSALGRRILGTEESVGSISRGDLAEYYRRHFVPENMVISIVVDEPEEEIEKRICLI